MLKWIIRKLGGYTNQDVLDMYADYITQISDLETKLIEARKNEHRHERGTRDKDGNPLGGRYKQAPKGE